MSVQVDGIWDTTPDSGSVRTHKQVRTSKEVRTSIGVGLDLFIPSELTSAYSLSVDHMSVIATWF